MAAPAFGSISTVAGSDATSQSVTVPSGAAAGMVMVAGLYVETTNAVTPPSGFAECVASPVATTGSGDFTWRVYWKRLTGADAGSYLFSWSGAAVWSDLWVCRYSGVIDTGDPWDTGAGAPVSASRSTAGTTYPTVSLTTLRDDRLLVHHGGSFQSGATNAASSGFTARDVTDSLIADKQQAAAGATGNVNG